VAACLVVFVTALAAAVLQTPGRVNTLPWDAPVVNSQGKLPAWYEPDKNRYTTRYSNLAGALSSTNNRMTPGCNRPENLLV
jgi:hypothetical protein